jgi:FkbM family methyltransferase
MATPPEIKYANISETSLVELLQVELARWLFQKLTRKATKCFMPSGDLITFEPSVWGIHEPDLDRLLACFSRDGHKDFLLDIGANVGLITCQNLHRFTRIYCFEPNPTTFKVLSANCDAAEPSKVTLFPFGLGTSDETVELSIPRGNLGGAFIHGHDNAYSDAILAKKDLFESWEESNYKKLPIQLKAGRKVLGELFTDLRKAGLTRGVIKIDVEGYEWAILREIAEVDRRGLDFVVIFENWDPGLRPESIPELFQGSHIYKFAYDFEGLSLLRRLGLYLIRSKSIGLRTTYQSPIGHLVYATQAWL